MPVSRTQSVVLEAEALVTSWREVEVGEAAGGQPRWCGFLPAHREAQVWAQGVSGPSGSSGLHSH